MATKDKGPWSDAARAKRKATMEAKKSNLGPTTSVPFDPNEPEPAKKPKKYKKRKAYVHWSENKKQPKGTTGYDKETVRACISKLMEML